MRLLLDESELVSIFMFLVFCQLNVSFFLENLTNILRGLLDCRCERKNDRTSQDENLVSKHIRYFPLRLLFRSNVHRLYVSTCPRVRGIIRQTAQKSQIKPRGLEMTNIVVVFKVSVGSRKIQAYVSQ
jgi:hypothetical protein